MAGEKTAADFYISCALGFEESLCQEIRECWPWLIEVNSMANQQPVPEMSLERGGVRLRCPLEMGLQLNFFLKTPHRILLRLAEFKVRDFPKLFEKVQKIPWASHLASANVEWVVAASKSRLNHEKRIEETCRESFAKIASGLQGGDPSHVQAIYVRMHEDICSISLDSSGENLHKRGWGVLKGEAPLRETLAALLLREMRGSESPGELQQITVVDPLCGSGTVVLEAASLWTPVFTRAFSFMHWRSTPKILKSPLLKKNYKLLMKATPFKAYRGFDLDPKVVGAAMQNLQALREQTELPPADIAFAVENLFEGESRRDLGRVWCLSNPPYGERLHVQGQQVFSYQDLINRMAEKFSAEKVAVLLPEKPLVRGLKPPPGFAKAKQVEFSNGGLEVVFLIYTRAK